jgi:hypothetical protein
VTRRERDRPSLLPTKLCRARFDAKGRGSASLQDVCISHLSPDGLNGLGTISLARSEEGPAPKGSSVQRLGHHERLGFLLGSCDSFLAIAGADLPSSWIRVLVRTNSREAILKDGRDSKGEREHIAWFSSDSNLISSRAFSLLTASGIVGCLCRWAADNKITLN